MKRIDVLRIDKKRRYPLGKCINQNAEEAQRLLIASYNRKGKVQ